MRKIIWIILFLIAAASILSSRPMALVDNRQVEGLGEATAGEIAKGQAVSQTFVAQNKFITGVGLMAGTYNRENHGWLKFKLFKSSRSVKSNLNEKPLATSEVPLQNITNNGQLIFWFQPVAIKRGDVYKISLTSDVPVGRGVTVWKSEKNVYKNGSSYINSKKISGDLVFFTYHPMPIKDVLIGPAVFSAYKPWLPTAVIIFLVFLMTFLIAFAVAEYS